MASQSTSPEPASAITLGPMTEATRLWEGATEAYSRAEWDLVSLCEALDLGIRAAEVLLIDRLQEVKSEFPATVQLHLEIPEPEVEVYRDAIAAPRSMHFTELIDLLSDEGLDCVGPGLHRGWEDRWAACRRSRATTHRAINIGLNNEQRHRLLTLAAYRNRIFRYPPPIRIVSDELQTAFPELTELMAHLLKGGGDV